MTNKAAYERAQWLAGMREAFAAASEGVRLEAERMIAEHRANPKQIKPFDYGDYTPRRLAGDADEGD